MQDERRNDEHAVYFDNELYMVSNNPDIQLTLNGHLCELSKYEKEDLRREHAASN